MRGSHEYTREDLDTRFTAIIGKTVAEADTAGVLSAPRAGKNKGRIGAVIEQSVLGYPADSDQRPDLDVDGEPWELKVTGLVATSRGKASWRAKEPMSVTAVSPDRIVHESFSTSTFWHKAEHLLIVYYLYVRPGKGVAVEYANFEFKGYDFHVWSVVDRGRLEADWTVILRRSSAGADASVAPVSGQRTLPASTEPYPRQSSKGEPHRSVRTSSSSIPTPVPIQNSRSVAKHAATPGLPSRQHSYAAAHAQHVQIEL